MTTSLSWNISCLQETHSPVKSSHRFILGAVLLRMLTVSDTDDRMRPVHTARPSNESIHDFLIDLLSALRGVTRFITATIYVMVISTDLGSPPIHDWEGFARPPTLILAVVLHVLHSDMTPVTDHGGCTPGPTGSRIYSCLSRPLSNQKREPGFCRVSKPQP